MAKRASDEHLPHWAWSVGALHDKGGERFWCPRCRLLFDVDLSHLIQVRGRGFSLVHRFPRCKVSSCRSRGVFVAAGHMHAMATVLERNKPDPARWKPIWTFARLEAEQRGRVGFDPLTMERQPL